MSCRGPWLTTMCLGPTGPETSVMVRLAWGRAGAQPKHADRQQEGAHIGHRHPAFPYLLGFLFRVHHGEVLQGLRGPLRAIGPHGSLSLSLLGFDGVYDAWQIPAEDRETSDHSSSGM